MALEPFANGSQGMAGVFSRRSHASHQERGPGSLEADENDADSAVRPRYSLSIPILYLEDLVNLYRCATPLSQI